MRLEALWAFPCRRRIGCQEHAKPDCAAFSVGTIPARASLNTPKKTLKKSEHPSCRDLHIFSNFRRYGCAQDAVQRTNADPKCVLETSPFGATQIAVRSQALAESRLLISDLHLLLSSRQCCSLEICRRMKTPASLRLACCLAGTLQNLIACQSELAPAAVPLHIFLLHPIHGREDVVLGKLLLRKSDFAS